jgi:hypothetical protein
MPPSVVPCTCTCSPDSARCRVGHLVHPGTTSACRQRRQAPERATGTCAPPFGSDRPCRGALVRQDARECVQVSCRRWLPRLALAGHDKLGRPTSARRRCPNRAPVQNLCTGPGRNISGGSPLAGQLEATTPHSFADGDRIASGQNRGSPSCQRPRPISRAHV